MNSDQIAATAKRTGGKTEETVGQALGDAMTRVEGAAKKAEGAAQELYGKAKDTATG